MVLMVVIRVWGGGEGEVLKLTIGLVKVVAFSFEQ
jgi:hypothetical protein